MDEEPELEPDPPKTSPPIMKGLKLWLIGVVDPVVVPGGRRGGEVCIVKARHQSEIPQ